MMATKLPASDQPDEDIQKQMLHELRQIEISTRDSFNRRSSGVIELVASGLLIVAGAGFILAAAQYDVDGVLCMAAPIGLALIGVGVYFARNLWK